MQVKGLIQLPFTTTLAVQWIFSTNQTFRVPDEMTIENNSQLTSKSTFLGPNVSQATAVTVHFDADESGGGTFTNDVITAVTLQPGAQQNINIDAVPINKVAGGQLRLRIVGASYAGTLQVTALYRYFGNQ